MQFDFSGVLTLTMAEKICSAYAHRSW